MKKSILFIFLFISVLAVGCSMNERMPKTTNIVQLATENTDKLINARFEEVETNFGSPYSATYYIDTNNLKADDLTSLTMDDLRDRITVVSTYENEQEENSYLYVYYEKGKVKETIVGNSDVLISEDFPSNTNLYDATFKVTFHKNRGVLCYDDFNLDYVKENYIGKSINDFNNSYQVKSANFIASTMDGRDNIYFYPLVTHNLHPTKEHSYPNYGSNDEAKLGNINPINNNISITNKSDSRDLSDYAESAVLIYTKDNKIKSVEIVDNQFVYDLIDKYLANNS